MLLYIHTLFVACQGGPSLLEKKEIPALVAEAGKLQELNPGTSRDFFPSASLFPTAPVILCVIFLQNKP